MNAPAPGAPDAAPHSPMPRRSPLKDMLLFAAFVAAWFALQRWILPRFGVPT